MIVFEGKRIIESIRSRSNDDLCRINDNARCAAIPLSVSSWSTEGSPSILATSSSSQSSDTGDSTSSSSSVLASSSISYPNWHNTVAGGIAGAGSRMATAPLDLIRIRRQLMSSVVTYPSPSLYSQFQTIIQTEGGITALYRGNMAAIYLWISYAAVQFTVFSAMKDALVHATMSSTTSTDGRTISGQNRLRDSPTAVAFIAGASAGVCATAATYPFDVCRTAFVARGVVTVDATMTSTSKTLSNDLLSNTMAQSTRTPPRTFLDFAIQVYQSKGIAGFYAGAFPAIIQVVPYMGLNFAIYDRLTRHPTSSTDTDNTNKVSHSSSVSLSAYAGSVSGAVSKILIYPLDTVKRRLQAQAFFGVTVQQPHYYTGMIDCFHCISKQEGFFSFYRGIVPSVLKTTISTALTFALFRMSKNILEGIHEPDSKRYAMADSSKSRSSN